MGQEGSAVEQVRAALGELRARYDALAQFVGSKSGQEGVELANIASEALRLMSDDMGRIRNKFAAEIWETEKLSLQSLANRIGVSKARADQIIRAAKTAQTKQEDPDV